MTQSRQRAAARQLYFGGILKLLYVVWVVVSKMSKLGEMKMIEKRNNKV